MINHNQNRNSSPPPPPHITSHKDLTIVLSAAGLAALHAHIFLRPRMCRVAQASPLRALRVGSGSLAVACFALPVLREVLWLPSRRLGLG